jgi:hypothetical protein
MNMKDNGGITCYREPKETLLQKIRKRTRIKDLIRPDVRVGNWRSSQLTPVKQLAEYSSK